MSKTWKRIKTVQETVTSAEASAGSKVIFIGTGVPQAATDVFAYVLGITRSGTPYTDVTNKAAHAYNTSSGAVIVQTNSTDYVMTTNDVITIMGTYI